MRFAAAVWQVIRRVPPGRVVTYGQVAALLDRPRAARAVGRAMQRCPDDVPWHRVLNARGAVSRRARADGMLTQRLRLEREGVVLRGGRASLRRYGWAGGRPGYQVARHGAGRGAGQPRTDRGADRRGRKRPDGT